MAKIYWRTIKRGTRTLADVPANLHAEIKELAIEDVRNGVISKEFFKETFGEDYTG